MRAELWYERPATWMPALMERVINTPLRGLVDHYIFTSLDVGMQETADAYKIEITVPGLKKKDLKMAVANGVLSIQGQKQQQKGSSWFGNSFEFKKMQFYRTFTLPEDADADHIKAKCKNGLLKISIPKVKSPKRVKTIPVEPVEPIERKSWWHKLIEPFQRKRKIY